MKYQITSKASVDMGIFDGESPEEALLSMHRDARCGPAVVRIEDGRLVFGSDEDRELCGDVEDWIIKEAGEEE